MLRGPKTLLFEHCVSHILWSCNVVFWGHPSSGPSHRFGVSWPSISASLDRANQTCCTDVTVINVIRHRRVFTFSALAWTVAIVSGIDLSGTKRKLSRDLRPGEAEKDRRLIRVTAIPEKFRLFYDRLPHNVRGGWLCCLTPWWHQWIGRKPGVNITAPERGTGQARPVG